MILQTLLENSGFQVQAERNSVSDRLSFLKSCYCRTRKCSQFTVKFNADTPQAKYIGQPARKYWK